MSYLLHIDTSTQNCSVALSKNDHLLKLKEINEGYSHAESLAIIIQEVLAENKVELTNLSAVAVAKGPGSYTGLRIGVSTAKGLCYGLNIPLISVNSLTAMVNQPNLPEASFYVPMIDARRMEVYCSVYDRQKSEITSTVASIVDQDSFNDYLNNGQVLFLGDGAGKCKDIITNPNASFSELGSTASGMVSLAFKKLENQDFEDVAYFEPFYLKDFVAGKPKKML